MAKSKTKRNRRTPKARDSFQISREPVVRLAADNRRQNGDSAVGLPCSYGTPILFAIARDSRCIFAGWNIDWPSVFEKTMPVDRQVYLRLYRADGLEEKSVAVEPMAGVHYVSTSEPQGFYRVEIGYYQPADVWNSIATTNEIMMAPHGTSETADVDLVTIPFHISFQQLVDSLGATDNTDLATAISQFQKRALSSEEPTRLSLEEKRTLCRIDVSLSYIEVAQRAFDKTDSEELARRTGAFLAVSCSSPFRGLEGDRASAGS
jgi:hypothetical protein